MITIAGSERYCSRCGVRMLIVKAPDTKITSYNVLTGDPQKGYAVAELKCPNGHQRRKIFLDEGCNYLENDVTPASVRIVSGVVY